MDLEVEFKSSIKRIPYNDLINKINKLEKNLDEEIETFIEDSNEYNKLIQIFNKENI